MARQARKESGTDLYQALAEKEGLGFFRSLYKNIVQKGGEFGNKFVFLQTNNINLVKNVAGVSASDDDLRYFEGSAGTLPHDKAVTLFYGSRQLMVQYVRNTYGLMDKNSMSVTDCDTLSNENTI